MIEREIWGEMTIEEYTTILTSLKERFGQPKTKKRLSIEVSDWNNQDLSNRIRITNGQPEFTQKVGDWNNESREEIEMPLAKDAEEIQKMYKVLINLCKGGDLRSYTMQHHNLVWDTAEYEVKISHQTGKTDKYNFEIEAKNEEVDIMKIAEELNLKADLSEKPANPLIKVGSGSKLKFKS